jgi:hypothetical protein
MAEDINTNDIVDDVVVDDVVVDDTPKSDNDFMNDTLRFIKDTQKANAGDDVDNDDVVDDSDNIDPELAGTDIPDEFSEAAEAYGMTPEQIQEFANTRTNAELLELVPVFKDMGNGLVDDKVVDDKVVDDKDKGNNVIDPEVEKALVEKITKDLSEKFGVSLEEIQEFKKSQQNQASQLQYNRACEKFDEAAKEFPIFGKTDELPKFTTGRLAGRPVPTSPAMKARLEVSKYADGFIGMGQSIDEAMENGLATYRGKHLTKDIERNLIKDLKRHEQKLSGSRTGKEVKRKFTDSREEMIDEIRQLQRAAGVDT